jgi:hypothetical protein
LLESPSQKYVSLRPRHDPRRLGEHDQAFAALDRTFEERSLWLGYLNVEPQLDPLRRDP